MYLYAFLTKEGVPKFSFTTALHSNQLQNKHDQVLNFVWELSNIREIFALKNTCNIKIEYTN